MTKTVRIDDFKRPAGGWTSVMEVAQSLLKAGHPIRGARILLHQNKPDGFACVSCSWAKPAHPHIAEFCEHGAKATAWELTQDRTAPAFFARHTLAELESWSDHDLEVQGRLTAPLRWDAASDRYVEVGWDEAFAHIAAELRALDPKSAVFYASGRASLETSYLYQLMARVYGCNNLPDSSNMCHESTSVGLKKAIGVGVGTVTLDDFDSTDCIFVFGHNVGTNAPRLLHPLQEARKRGAPIVTFNPLREAGLVHFANPLSPLEMLTPKQTVMSTQYLQVKAGGDLGAITGLCKALFDIDEAAVAADGRGPIDRAFIAKHGHGFAEFEAAVRGTPWADIVRESGLAQAALTEAAHTFARAKRVIGVYGMGLTQHRTGVLNVQMVSNLLLMGGHMGRPGAGICPVRGHSNVQGQRTVGITEKPELAPLDKLAELYGFEPPREKGLSTVEACEGVIDGSVKAFVGLGGNFLRAVPETARMEAAWRRLRLTVQIATKLNRSHIVHGEVAYLLPCLGRIEIDTQAGGEQAVSMEDSTGCFHGSRGRAEPASPQLLSETAIVAGIARHLLPPSDRLPWDAWVGDYALIREAIGRTYPDIFGELNARMWQPGGLRRPMPVAQRVWKTESGRANFIAPPSLVENPDMPAVGADVLRLTTLRSFDQFNTTVYGMDDHFRGIHGTRRVLMMNAADIARLGLADGEIVDVSTVADDGIDRRIAGMRIVGYDIPPGCIAGYFPECNPLVPLWHHAEGSQVPAVKSIPVRLHGRATAGHDRSR